MAIRFQCPACFQPIEVDDDLASRVVACPYCRKTISAPAASTLAEAAQVPTAAPLGAGRAAGPHYHPGAEPRGNPLAVVAFILAMATLTTFILFTVILVNHRIEFEELIKEIQEAGGGSAGQFQAMGKYMQARGGAIPTWFLAMGLLFMASLGTCGAGLICGLLALRRPQGRGLATAAITICAIYVVLNCAGMIMG